jgi:DNA repair exonuclease SbcCD ATPase subunit
VINDNQGVRELKSSADSIRQEIEKREKQIEEDRRRLQEIEDKKDTQSTTKTKLKKETPYKLVAIPFVPLVI